MKTVSLPTIDHTGLLSPLVLEARANGAVAALDPADPHSTLILCFDKDADAKAFKAKVTKVAKGSDEVAEAFEALAEHAKGDPDPEADKGDAV